MMTSESPQEKFDRVIEVTAEQLHSLGFSRRKRVFRILRPETSGLVEFQRSTKNSQDKLLFTINLGIVCGDLLESGPSDLPRAKIIDAHIRLRIGALLSGRPDKWWEITANTDIDTLSREVADLILGKVVPYIRQYFTVDSVLALWESGQSPGLTDGQRVDLLTMLKAKRQKGGVL